MFPVLFRIGHFWVSTYGVLAALAALVGGWVAARGFRERKLSPDDAWSLVVWGVLAGFAGGKVYYVALQGDLSALWSRGGFVWYGGLIGGAVAVGLLARHKNLPLGSTADAFAPALALGQAIGHLGCFFSGDSYGLPSSLPWAVAFRYGAPPSTLALGAIFAILWSARRAPRQPGWLFGWYLLLAGAERFLVEFLRAKDDRFLWGLTTAQAIALAAVVAGLTLLATRRPYHPPPQHAAVRERPGRPARPRPHAGGVTS